MLKTLSFAITLLFATTLALPAQDKSVHHSAMHAEHWVKNHSSAPQHVRRRRHLTMKHASKSVHHAAMHGEHWVKNHASAPHKKQ